MGESIGYLESGVFLCFCDNQGLLKRLWTIKILTKKGGERMMALGLRGVISKQGGG